MPSIDPAVAHILDRSHPADSDDEDALIAELENETNDDNAVFSSLREKRLEQLHAEVSRAKTLKATSHGTYTIVKDEKQLMDITTTTKLCVVHFSKSDFNRCRVMEEKLRLLAEKHFDTRFVGIDVENAPFLVVKLGVQVLPCVLAFKDGVSLDRIIGFEGIGYRPDNFTVKELEARLLNSGVLLRAKMTKDDDYKRAQREAKEQEEQFNEDDEWD